MTGLSKAGAMTMLVNLGYEEPLARAAAGCAEQVCRTTGEAGWFTLHGHHVTYEDGTGFRVEPHRLEPALPASVRREAGCCHEPEGRETALAPGYEPGPGEYESWYPHLASGTASTETGALRKAGGDGCGGSCSCHGMSMSGICGTCCSGEEPPGPALPASARQDPDLAWLLHVIPVVDRHLDDAAPPEYRDNPLANMWRRFSAGPVSEAAEAIDALNGMTGGNPRKGVTHTKTELLAEAADTAFSALLAIQSQTKDIAATWAIFTGAAAKAYGRVPDGGRPGQQAPICGTCGTRCGGGGACPGPVVSWKGAREDEAEERR